MSRDISVIAMSSRNFRRIDSFDNQKMYLAVETTKAEDGKFFDKRRGRLKQLAIGD
jgi:hypothetical protein